MKPTPFNAFMAGVTTHAGITMARQDWMGLEGYIEYLHGAWVDLHWLAGASIALMGVHIYVTIWNQYRKAKNAPPPQPVAPPIRCTSAPCLAQVHADNMKELADMRFKHVLELGEIVVEAFRLVSKQHPDLTTAPTRVTTWMLNMARVTKTVMEEEKAYEAQQKRRTPE